MTAAKAGWTTARSTVTTRVYSNDTSTLLDDSMLDDDTFTPQAMIFGPILVILIIAGIVGNLFTIITIALIRRLRTLPNYLSINLALSDLVTAVFVNSILLHNILTNNHLSLNTFACDVTGYASSITPLTSLMILSTIAFQRYASSSQNEKLKAFNKSKVKMAFDIALPWIISTIFDIVLNKVMNEGHIWDKKIHMCIYVHTDWRVSTTHFVFLVVCTLLIFSSHWYLSRATYSWPSVRNNAAIAKSRRSKRLKRNSFYISVAGKTVSLQNYQAFKVRASLRRTFLLLMIFIFTCFPWYTLALINSIYPLGDSAPSVVWLTAAILEHANCSLNFFINSALSHRYRKLVARHMPLPPVIAQRLIRATHTRPSGRVFENGDAVAHKNGVNTRSRTVFFRSTIDITAEDSELGALQAKAHRSTASFPASNDWVSPKLERKTIESKCDCEEVFEEENETIFLHI